MSLKTPLWKGFWLLCLPVAVIYQLSWELAFQQIASNSTFIQHWQIIIAVKLAVECALYATMLWYLYKFTYSKQAVFSLITFIGFFALLAFTLNALYGIL